MLFNSFEFIFVFLPIVFLGYFLLNKVNFKVAKWFLFISSLFFYGWWNPLYLPLFLASLIINYLLSVYLRSSTYPKHRKAVLTLGIIFNISLIGFFKYFDFIINNINLVFQTHFELLHLLLPLAISFYTFQQIAYLVDAYRNETKEHDFLNYALFIAFFPQLIAGPIVHHTEVIRQYNDPTKKQFNWENIAKGLFIFSMGLFKKIGIADVFAEWANTGFSLVESLTFFDSWVTSLSYTFQLYFDFSGYSDMAIGLALLFNILIPINFNSPYKATSIADFWSRWHMTLSRFLTHYIYIPLGGNRISQNRTYLNILIVFLISGLWHGAGWTFVIWGALHGIASVINRIWKDYTSFKLPRLFAWLLTFQFINATWVIFRAPDLSTAKHLLKTMFGFNGIHIPEQIGTMLKIPTEQFGHIFYPFTLNNTLKQTVLFLFGAFILTVFFKNSVQVMQNLKPRFLLALFTASLFIYSTVHLLRVSEFLYFNF